MKKIHLLFSCVLSVAALFFGFASQGQVISTIAGSTEVGGGGPPPPPPAEGVAATASTLYDPYGMAKDASGNLYFADYLNNMIRKVDPTGIISIVAGNGTPGWAGDGGLANAAGCELYEPKGVALDDTGNIYISDFMNNRVRMINHTTGIISTIAGTGSAAAPYGDMGLASAAHINPNGIVVGAPPAGIPGAGVTIYVSDGTAGNYVVHAIVYVPAPFLGGYGITTIAGSAAAGTAPWGDGGAATAANLYAPRGLALDASGNLYIADMDHNLIRMVSATTGNISTVVGNDLNGPPTYGAGYGGDGGSAISTACKINLPTGVAVDASGNLYIADVSNDLIRYVSGGNISTKAGVLGATGTSPYGDGGAPLSANLSAPVSVLLDGTSGNYYIADETHDRIRYVNASAASASPPTFTGGSPQSLVVCENSGAASLNTLLQVAETTSGVTLSWSVATAPTHGGTLTATYSTTSTGSSITPTGLSYTPPTGYSGTDAFTIKVSAGTLTATTTINVTVNPIPPVAAIGGSVTGVCVGANVTVTDATTGGVWAVANTNARVAGGTITGLTAGAEEIFYIVSNSCGPDTARLAITIDPSAAPSVSLTSTLGTTTCGVPGTFAAIAVNGGTTPGYQWSVNGTPVIGATLPSYTYVPASGDVVSVALTSDAPCTFGATATTSITMSGGTSIVPTINIATGLASDTLCIGVPTTLTTFITNGGSSPVYNWTVNGVTSGSGSTFLYTPSATSEGDIIVCELTSSIPCAIPASVLSNDIIIHIRSAATSSVNITANPGSVVCDGTTITFVATETGGGDDPFLRWSRAGVNVATGPSYSCVPDDGDVVYCTMHSSIACTPTDSVNSNIINMRVSVPVMPTVTITSNITSTGLYGTIVFSANVTSATLTPVYQWYVNGVAVPGAVASVYVLNGNLIANYIVNCVVGSGDGCNLNGTSNDISVSVGLGVKSTTASTTEMKLVPNPNKGVFSLTLQSDINEQAEVAITNILGEKVKTLSITTNNTVEISLDEPAGIYILTATTGEGRYEAKVMVN